MRRFFVHFCVIESVDSLRSLFKVSPSTFGIPAEGETISNKNATGVWGELGGHKPDPDAPLVT